MKTIVHWLHMIKCYLYTKSLKWEVARVEKQLVAHELLMMQLYKDGMRIRDHR